MLSHSREAGWLADHGRRFTIVQAGLDLLDEFALFHTLEAGSLQVTAELLRYECSNDPRGCLFLLRDAHQPGVAATAAFVYRQFQRGRETCATLMLERVLCRRSLRGSGVYGAFLKALVTRHIDPTIRAVWGVTAVPGAFTRVGFSLLGSVLRLTGSLPPAAGAAARLLPCTEEELAGAHAAWLAHATEAAPALDVPTLRWLFTHNPLSAARLVRVATPDSGRTVGFAVLRTDSGSPVRVRDVFPAPAAAAGAPSADAIAIFEAVSAGGVERYDIWFNPQSRFGAETQRALSRAATQQTPGVIWLALDPALPAPAWRQLSFGRFWLGAR